MSAHLGKTCACGRTKSVPCPTLADMAAALEQFAGWTYDERGRVRCPECTASPPAEIATPAPRQHELFEGAA